MQSKPLHPLITLERRLRTLLPAQLYVDLWTDPSLIHLNQAFKHLRTLLYILGDYVPTPVKRNPPVLGETRMVWQEGSLLFSDLAGFTPFMEAHAISGQTGAQQLLRVLNQYFAVMIEIISKSGGELLEFTGDAILAQFLKTNYSCDVAQAVRAGLRMQRAMSQFQPIETPNGQFNLTMRVGIHCGSFLAADLGSPLRMSRVLLGQTVREAKRAEGRGQVGRVCLTQGAIDHLQEPFQLEPHDPYYLVIDDSQEGNLGEYEIGVGKRLAAPLLLDRSPEALLEAIVTLLNQIEPLACYQSESVLRLLVEYAAERQIPPDLSDATVVFVSLIGLAGRVDQANPQEQEALVRTFSRLFASIHATVYAHGGILHRVTYHIQGSDILIYFGVPNAHNNDSIRAALAALAIRDQIRAAPPLTFQTEQVQFECKIGITKGRVFIGEVGEPRSRREYNILGDVVNTAARLMTQAESNQILMTTAVHQALQTEALLSTNAPEFTYQFLGEFLLKGKSSPVAIYTLQGQSN